MGAWNPRYSRAEAGESQIQDLFELQYKFKTSNLVRPCLSKSNIQTIGDVI